MSNEFPVVQGKEILRALRKAGWEVFHVRGSHHQLEHTLKKKKVTIPIHAGKDLKRKTLKSILEKVEMSMDEFRKLL